jgi:hypothetical protein
MNFLCLFIFIQHKERRALKKKEDEGKKEMYAVVD